MASELNDVPRTTPFTQPDRSEKSDKKPNLKFYNFFMRLFNRVKSLASRIYNNFCSNTCLIKRKTKKTTHESTVTLDPPTKLPNDLHREAKTNTDDTFEEKAKKATKENTETTDPPKEARTNTDYLFETEVTLSTNKKEVTFSEEFPVIERPFLPPEHYEYGAELYAERINTDAQHALAYNIMDITYYDDIRNTFANNDALDQLAKLSGLSSDEVFDALKKTNFFDESDLQTFKESNVNLEGSPHW